MNNRVAVIISGHERDLVSRFYQYKEKILDPNPNYTFDVYMHLWDKSNSKKSFGYESRGWSEYTTRIEPTNVSKLIELYNPNEINIEKESNRDFTKLVNQIPTKYWTDGPDRIYGIYSQYYSFVRATSLACLNRDRYSTYIRYRGGIILPNNIIVDDYQEPNSIYVGTDGFNMFPNFISDKFALCSNLAINAYQYLYYDMSKLCDVVEAFCPEKMLFEVMRKKGVKIVVSNQIGEVRVN